MPFKDIEQRKKWQNTYYSKNCVEINKKKKIFQIANAERLKEKFNCPCGRKYTFQEKRKHIKTIKHIKYLNNLIME